MAQNRAFYPLAAFLLTGCVAPMHMTRSDLERVTREAGETPKRAAGEDVEINLGLV